MAQIEEIFPVLALGVVFSDTFSFGIRMGLRSVGCRRAAMQSVQLLQLALRFSLVKKEDDDAVRVHWGAR